MVCHFADLGGISRGASLYAINCKESGFGCARCSARIASVWFSGPGPSASVGVGSCDAPRPGGPRPDGFTFSIASSAPSGSARCSISEDTAPAPRCHGRCSAPGSTPSRLARPPWSPRAPTAVEHEAQRGTSRPPMRRLGKSACCAWPVPGASGWSRGVWGRWSLGGCRPCWPMGASTVRGGGRSPRRASGAAGLGACDAPLAASAQRSRGMAGHRLRDGPHEAAPPRLGRVGAASRGDRGAPVRPAADRAPLRSAQQPPGHRRSGTATGAWPKKAVERRFSIRGSNKARAIHPLPKRGGTAKPPCKNPPLVLFFSQN